MFKAAFALGALAHSFSGRFLEASWRRCHISSGFSLSQFVLFLHAFYIPCAYKNLTGLLQLMKV